MTLVGAEQVLARAVEQLWQAVGELALTVYEDRPAAADLAVVDDLAEQVSELQGEVAAARGVLRAALVPDLPELAAHLDAATRRYWRRMRAYAPVAELRRAARRSGDAELAAWQRSVETGAARCEEPLAACATAVNACWREVFGAAPPVPPPPSVPADPGAGPGVDPRRSS
jgi:hypothetical protein